MKRYRSMPRGMERRDVSMSLAIVTVAHNSGHVLPSFVAAARRAAPDANIVVVDNDSTDRGIDLVDGTPGVEVVRTRANLGFGRACNVGAKAAGSDIVLFANPDTILRQCDLSDDELPSGLAGGILVNPEGTNLQGLRPEQSSLESLAWELFARLRPTGMPLPRIAWRRPGFANGALAAVRTSEFLELGGFDERFFLYHEDRDLGRRYAARGYPLRLLGGLQAEHCQGTSSNGHANATSQAWSLVSAIEYVGIWNGTPAARRFAIAAVATLSAMVRILPTAARLGPGRRTLLRKADEYAEVMRCVVGFDQRLPLGSSGFYPHVEAVMGTARRYAASV